VWQTKELQERVFGSVANTGVTGEIMEVWQGKDLAERGEEGRSRKKGPTQRARRRMEREEPEKEREVRGGASWSVQFKDQGSTLITKCQ
jgi:hypothetical protein